MHLPWHMEEQEDVKSLHTESTIDAGRIRSYLAARRNAMRVSRTLLYGGLIGGVAISSHLAFDGLIGAAGLFVAIFTLLVASGVVLAALTDGASLNVFARVGSSVRSFRHRGRALCGVCARLIIDTGTVRVCTACDRIPVPVTT